MKNLDLNYMNLSSLIYLVFPITSLFLFSYNGEFWVLISIMTLFTVAYTTLIICHKLLSPIFKYVLLVVHYVGIIYFVYAFGPLISLFLFYSAFALPFHFKVGLRSKEYATFLITMFVCVITTYLFYPGTTMISIGVFYIVINMIMFSNFKIIENQKYKQELEEKNQQINVLIAEQERNRIGQDLHDTLGHVFVSLSLKSELALKLIDNEPERAKSEIVSLNEISKAAITKVRTIIDDLKVQSFEEEVIALEALLKNVNLSFTFKDVHRAHTLNPSKQALLSMVLREAVNNVIRHAEATKVRASLADAPGGLLLEIADDGKGIDDMSHVHLQSIQARVDVLNGDLQVENRQGLHITVFIPRGDVS